MKNEKLYTQQEVDLIVETKVKEALKDLEEKHFTNDYLECHSYYLERIVKHLNVIERRNVLYVDQHLLNEFIPLIERITFEKFNSIILDMIDNNQKSDQLDTPEND